MENESLAIKIRGLIKRFPSFQLGPLDLNVPAGKERPSTSRHAPALSASPLPPSIIRDWPRTAAFTPSGRLGHFAAQHQVFPDTQ
jgi:hypothetical protein